MSGSHRSEALQNFRFTNGFHTTTGAVSAASLGSPFISRWNGLSNADKVKDAQHGRLGACTYADVVPGSTTPINAYVHGFIYSYKGTSDGLALRGPRDRDGSTLLRPTSGIVLADPDLFGLLHPRVKAIYGNSPDRDTAVANALEHMRGSGDDPCRLYSPDGFLESLASEITLRIAAFEEPQNIVYKKISGEISPKDCAIKTYKAPVSNPGQFLEGASGESGAVYALRRLPEKVCLHHFMDDTTGSITGARLQAQSQFDAAIGLETTIKDLNNTNSSKVIAQLTAPRSANLIAKIFADLNWSEFDTWRDSRDTFSNNQTLSGTCFGAHNPNFLRGCSWTNQSSPCYSPPYYYSSPGPYRNFFQLNDRHRKILKLAYELRNQNPGSQAPYQFFNGTKARDTLDYYSSAEDREGIPVGGGGTQSTPWTTGHDNNFLNDAIGSSLFSNHSQFDTAVTRLTHTESLQGYSAASPPRQISVNQISLVLSVSNNNGTVSASDSFPRPVNLYPVTTADTLDSGPQPPRTIDRLGSGFAHTPGEPLSSGSFTYPKTNYAAASEPSSATPCLIFERQTGASWTQVPTNGYDLGNLSGDISNNNYVKEASAGRYRVSIPGRSDINGQNCAADVTDTTHYLSVGQNSSPFEFEVKRKWTSEYMGDANSKSTNLTIHCGTNYAKNNIVTQTFQAPDGLLRSKVSGSFEFKYYPNFQHPGNPNCNVTGSPANIRLYYDSTGVNPPQNTDPQIYPLIWGSGLSPNCRTPVLYTSGNLNSNSMWDPPETARHFQYSSGCNSGGSLGFEYDSSQGRFKKVCPP